MEVDDEPSPSPRLKAKPIASVRARVFSSSSQRSGRQKRRPPARRPPRERSSRRRPRCSTWARRTGG
eukprot:7452419-Pyramimonas_sp.AAC.1